MPMTPEHFTAPTPPRTGPQRWRWAAVAVASAVLAACGGSGTDEGSQQATASAGRGGEAPAPTLADLTITADSTRVTTSGSFLGVDGYLSKSARVLRGTGQATLSLRVPQAGRYEVYAWWPQGLADAGTVEIAVHAATGAPPAFARKDQRIDGGQWVSIGVFEFQAAGAGTVQLRGLDGAPVYVDAVRLRQLGAEQADGPAFATSQLPIGLKGEPYTAELPTTGGRPPFSFSVAQGALPGGLTLNADTGLVTGQPTTRGEHSFTLSVRDAQGRSATRTFTLLIDESAGRASSAPGMEPGASRMRAQSLMRDASTSGTPDVSTLLNIVAAMPEGEWRKVNLNFFSDVWTPAALRPLYGSSNPTPSRIILAWSSFAWDPNRATLLLYGGGHANYRGNDVYQWRASTQRWERAALPSEMVQTPLGDWNAIDGVAKAPASAHTYDNTIFLPLLDRMLVLGGAADPSGGHYLTMATATTRRATGPYLFDPSRAHPDRVGGSTGSHVKRVAPYTDIVGGDMWSNREAWLDRAVGSQPPTEALTNGCTGYAVENGRDVVYVRSASRLYRYEIPDLANPAADSWRQVGQYYYGGSGGQSTCAYDPERQLFLSTHLATPLIFWRLNNPSTISRDTLVTPTDPTGEFPTLLASSAIKMRDCAIDFDPVRKDFKLWCADGRVWSITPPTPLAAAGWVIQKAPAPVGAVPTESIGTGVLGKWKYIPNLDVFMGLADAVQGNIWIYKPHGWVNPGGGTAPDNVAPSVGLTAPANGAQFNLGADITMSAAASDSDGLVTKVEFLANGVKIGESAGPSFSLVWSGAPLGTHQLTAVATDDDGATQTSAAVSITVNPVAVNQAPVVGLTQPSDGSSFIQGSPITIAATASDPDGSIASVEFFAGSTSLGSVTSAPFTITWTQAPLGASTITAVATDNAGATTVSAARTVTVVASSSGGSATIQRGINPTAQVWDTYLSHYHRSLSFGASVYLQDQNATYPILLRFAIFQSEGGPVPNGAQVSSATLSIYKYSSYNMSYALHQVLQDWSETAATWNQRLPGVAWATAGAGGAGTDYAAAADATAATDFNPGWVAFDVTAGVQQMSQAASPGNFGWRLRGTAGYMSGIKRFHAAEASDPALRPKLAITWQ